MKKILCFLFILLSSCTHFSKDSYELTQPVLEISTSNVLASQYLISKSSSSDNIKLDNDVSFSLDFFIANTNYKINDVSKLIANVTYEMRVNGDKPFLFDFLEVSALDTSINIIPFDEYAIDCLYYNVSYLFFVSASGNDFRININYLDNNLFYDFIVIENNSEFNYIGNVNSEWDFKQNCVLLTKYDEYLEVVNRRWFEKPCSFDEAFFENNSIYLAHIYTTIYVKKISFVTFFSCEGWLYAQVEINANKNVDIDPLTSYVFWISIPKKAFIDVNSLGLSCYKTEDVFNV